MKKNKKAVVQSRADFISRLPINAIVAEIGVWVGGHSKLICNISEPKELHLIDPWEWNAQCADAHYKGEVKVEHDEAYQEAVNRLSVFPGVEFHRMTSTLGSKKFPDEYFDWVYIDGDHRYDAVINDLNIWRSKVKPGGYLTGHDLDVPGEWRLGDRIPDERCPVNRALIHFLENQDLRISFTSDPVPGHYRRCWSVKIPS